MTREALEALRRSGAVRVFSARWPLLGRGEHSEGCRGVVESVGSPADPDVVIVRDMSGGLHRWDRHHVSVLN